MAEKELAADSPLWKQHYERHLKSATEAINDLRLRGSNVETEGEMTYEDGMIGCTATQLAYYALYFAKPEEKQQFLDAALQMTAGHQCLSQNIIPDSRMNGASLRFWESGFDVNIRTNLMNSPHGWSAWRIYGLYYLYLITGEEDWLRQTYNALGTCVQLVHPESGDLRWGFISDPYIQADVFVESDVKGKGKYVRKTIGEQYIPMISGWNKAPKGKSVDWFGNCDNDVHEIFKALEEVALTAAYVVERADGSLSAYNCTTEKVDGAIIITPAEDVVSRVHVNLKKQHKVKIKFSSGQKVTSSNSGMQWISTEGFPVK